MILTPGAGVYDILAGRPGVQAVPAQDPRATAEAIRRWRSGEGREGLESTRAWLREEYALDSYVARMEQIYTDVMGAGARRPRRSLGLPQLPRAARSSTASVRSAKRAQENSRARVTRELAELGAARWRVQQSLEPVGDARDVARIGVLDRVAADLGQRGRSIGEHRRAGGHRLEHRQAEALAERRVAEHRAAAVELGERGVGDVAEQDRARSPSERSSIERLACLPAERAHHHERMARLRRRVELAVGSDQPRQILARLERADRQHEAGLRQRLLGRALLERRARSPGARRSSARPKPGSGAASASAVAWEIAITAAARRTAGAEREALDHRRAAVGPHRRLERDEVIDDRHRRVAHEQRRQVGVARQEHVALALRGARGRAHATAGRARRSQRH